MMEDRINIFKNVVEQHIKDYYGDNDFCWFMETTIYDLTEFKYRSTTKKYLAITGWMDESYADFEKTITYYIHPRIKGRKVLKTKLALFGFNHFQDNIPF